MSLHITYCQEFGVSQEEIENTEELQGTFTAWCRPKAAVRGV